MHEVLAGRPCSTARGFTGRAADSAIPAIGDVALRRREETPRGGRSGSRCWAFALIDTAQAWVGAVVIAMLESAGKHRRETV
jgi:hypothetical protein